MKKYFLFLSGILLIACANTTEEKSGASTLAASTQPADSKPAGGGTVDCGSQLYFKKGVELETSTYQGDGTLVRKDKTHVTDVRHEAGMTVADAESTEITEGKKTESKVFHTSYKCDGQFFYVDMSQLMSSMNTGKGAKMNVSDISFPINIKDGEELPDASLTLEMSYGSRSMNTKVTYKERKVIGTESITISGRSWKCYKVSSVLETEMTGLDEKTAQVMKTMQAGKPKTKSVIWFAPDAGFLRYDLYTGDALKTYSQVTAIKN